MPKNGAAYKPRGTSFRAGLALALEHSGIGPDRIARTLAEALNAYKGDGINHRLRLRIVELWARVNGLHK